MTSSGSLWLAILITVIASTASSVGKALQKEATRHLPKFSLEDKILREYRMNKTWIAGLTADLLGGIIQVAAFALAPVSIVQPVSGVGLVGLAVYSHFYMREKLQEWEWIAVAMAGIGTIGLGASSSSSASSQDSTRPSILRMLFVLILVGVGIASINTLRNKQRKQRRHGGGTTSGTPSADKAIAALYGLQAGGCFGLSASSCRTGFLMASYRWTWVPFGLLCSIGLSSSGFILQTCGLKEGSTVVVCTCVAVTSMVTGVLVGILGLGETLPGSNTVTMIRLLSWNLILIGVVALASGPGGMQELLAVALQHVPASVWQKIPTNMAVALKKWATSATSGLPEVTLPSTKAAAIASTGNSSINANSNVEGAIMSPRISRGGHDL